MRAQVPPRTQALSTLVDARGVGQRGGEVGAHLYNEASLRTTTKSTTSVARGLNVVRHGRYTVTA